MDKTTPGGPPPGVAAPPQAASVPVPLAMGDKGFRQPAVDDLLPCSRPGRWALAWQGFTHQHPHLFDALLAVIIFLSTTGSMVAAERMLRAPTPPPWAWIASALGCAALLFRRRYPWAVLAVTTVAFMAVQALTQDVPLLILTVVTALVTITLAGQRRAAIISAVAITLLTIVIGTATDEEYWSHPRPLAVAALGALAIAGAEAMRNRRNYIAAVEERARRAEESREREAQRRVGDERLRIARELHDVLAHHIAVINVQAGVAGHLLTRQPDKAREALDHVRDAARSVLSEMQAVVTVLREPGESTGPVEPAPGVDRIGAEIERFRGLGLTIDTVVSGVPVLLPAAVDLVAYRVVQESLTNAAKHAPGAQVEIFFDHQPGTLTIRVTNSPGTTGTPGTDQAGGFGLIGMRERVSSVGGQLRVGHRADGGFVTVATLPLPA
jgi:signal transduction histidine kinase